MLDRSADQRTSLRRIRLVIADPQPIVLHGFKSVFAAQQDFEIVASCSSGTGCLETIRKLAPDVALSPTRCLTCPDSRSSPLPKPKIFLLGWCSYPTRKRRRSHRGNRRRRV